MMGKTTSRTSTSTSTLADLECLEASEIITKTFNGDVIQYYSACAGLALHHSREQLRARVKQEKKSHCGAEIKATRLEADGGLYLADFLEPATIGTPTAYKEYHQLGQINPDSFVVCSWRQAEGILRQGPPTRPILIRNSKQTMSRETSAKRHTISSFLRQLQGEVDVHDFGLPACEGRWPVAKPACQATQAFQGRDTADWEHGVDSSKHPLNLFELQGSHGSVPQSLQQLKEYHVLDNLGPDGELRDKASFRLLANLYALHLPHIDRHANTKTIFCDQGTKLWLSWPGISLDKLRRSVRDEGETPHPMDEKGAPIPPVAIWIGPGSTLIQPSGTLHAPYSMTDVLLTGTMHWHAQGLKDVLRQTKAELDIEELTNEEPATNSAPYLRSILACWQRGKCDLNMGNEADLEECKALTECVLPKVEEALRQLKFGLGEP